MKRRQFDSALLASSVAGALAALSLGASRPALANTPASAEVLALKGEVKRLRGGSVQTLAVGDKLDQGDGVATGAASEVVLKLEDGARLALRGDSAFSLEALPGGQSLSSVVGTLSFARPAETASMSGKLLRLARGGLRFVSSKMPNRQAVVFVTPTATIGIRGTDIELKYVEDAPDVQADGTLLRVNSGAAYLSAADGSRVDLAAGEVAFGGQPELTPKSFKGRRRPAARKLEEPSKTAFAAGGLDNLLN